METPHKNVNGSFKDEDIFPVSNTLEELLLNIMTTTGLHKVAVRATATVEQLQHVVRERLKVPNNKSVRLIFRGRVLENGNTIESYSITNSSFVHCSISDQLNSEQQRRINNTVRERRELRGLDRLRDLGFSDTEVEQLRTQFHSHRLINSGFLNSASDLTPENLRSLEEEWMNSEVGIGAAVSGSGSGSRSNRNRNQNIVSNNQNGDTVISMNGLDSSVSIGGNNSGVASVAGGVADEERNAFGTYEDFVKGIAMGFFLNFIMILWLTEQSLPSRTKAGVLVGFSASVCFGILKLLAS